MQWGRTTKRRACTALAYSSGQPPSKPQHNSKHRQPTPMDADYTVACSPVLNFLAVCSVVENMDFFSP